MTDTTNTTGGTVPTTYNIIAVSFDEDVNTYAALSKLKELDAQGQIQVHEAVVAQRAQDGSVSVKDQVGGDDLEATAGGGLLGMLVGVIGGPIGVLIGGTTGLLFGSLADLDESDHIETALGHISKTVEPGRTQLLAVVTEPSTEIVDAAMAPLSGGVYRRSVYEVQVEVNAIQEAERKAARAAKRELVRAKGDALKAKLGGNERAPTTSA